MPIFLKESFREVLGGSGNVLNNLASLGTKTSYLSIIGNDENGKKIKRAFKETKY